MDDAIYANSITKSFKDVVAISRATLIAKKGINIIIGPNGAGKSTLLRCIAGLYSPETGSVRVFGKDPYHDDNVRNYISLLSDNYALYDKLTVMNNLLFFGRLYGIDDRKIKEFSMQMLRRLDADMYISRKAGELSRGTKQKIALCRALINEPRAILLDEPTAFLDATSSEKVHRMLEDFADEGRIVLYATQRLNEATRFNATLFMIKKGNVSHKMTTGDLYAKMLKDSTVNIRLGSAISASRTRRMPHFEGMNGPVIKIVINNYRQINESVSYLIRNRAYIVSIDYTEPLIEKMMED